MNARPVSGLTMNRWTVEGLASIDLTWDARESFQARRPIKHIDLVLLPGACP
jgi:hypothetical protein